MRVSVVSETAKFMALRDEWANLIERSTTATVFDTFEWASSWWEVFGTRSLTIGLHVIVMRDNEGIVRGIVPLCRTKIAVPGLARLTFIGGRLSDYHDAIASTGDEEAVVASFCRYLEEHGQGLTADLQNCKDSSNLVRYFSQHSELLVSTSIRQEECPYLRLPTVEAFGTDRWEHLLKTFSKKMRSNIRYYDRALDRIYAVDRLVACTDEDVHAGIDALITLHQRRWNKRGLPGVFVSRAVRRFHLRLSLSLLKRQELRLHILKLDGSIEAVLYCFLFKGITSYYQSGFEPTLAKRSLGTVLTGLAIKQACEDGSREFDFLRGFEQYKSRWVGTTHLWTNRIILSRRDSLTFAFIVRTAQFETVIERKIKQLAERIN